MIKETLGTPSFIPDSFDVQQTADTLSAINLANLANEAFDYRVVYARRIAEVIPMGVGPADSSYQNDKGRFALADSNFKLFSDAATTLMPSREAFDAGAKNESTTWSLLNPEQKEEVANVRGAMIEQFGRYGVDLENLPVVMTESAKGERIFYVAYSGNGIDIGGSSKVYDKAQARSFNSIMSNKNDKLFVIKVDGVKYDTRKGMTAAVYDALYADAQADPDKLLPDSQEASEKANDLWTLTMLTGEPLTAVGRAQIRYVRDGGVVRVVRHPDDGDRALRVRPAVEIK